MKENMSQREKAILIGLYLSKFDQEGLQNLGLSSFKEACNCFGFAIGVKPASIKNYRDELDPYFPNPRAGWHKRPLRDHCKKIYELFGTFDIQRLSDIIIGFSQITHLEEINAEDETQSSFAKRVMTGKAAENYFIKHHKETLWFRDSEIIDVTHSGCGYDFRLYNGDSKLFFAVEVKGLSTAHGTVAMTNKEFFIAHDLKESFFLYVVKNFSETPIATAIRNPANSDLTFKKTERRIIQTSWISQV
jgi:hypothetical protein